MPFSTFLSNELLDHVWGNAAYTAPGTIYVGLSSTTPTVGGTNVTEPSGGGYARVAVTNNATNWPAASAGAKTNGTTITFAAASADWLTGANLTHAVMYDALTSGNFLGFGALTTAKPVLNGDTASFSAGNFDIAIS